MTVRLEVIHFGDMFHQHFTREMALLEHMDKIGLTSEETEYVWRKIKEHPHFQNQRGKIDQLRKTLDKVEMELQDGNGEVGLPKKGT